jgi:hypothetical protein
MIDESYNAVKNDFVTLSDAFAHLSGRSCEGNEMMFMRRKTPALCRATNFFSSSRSQCHSLSCM